MSYHTQLRQLCALSEQTESQPTALSLMRMVACSHATYSVSLITGIDGHSFIHLTSV
jgi:hypothetical protein